MIHVFTHHSYYSARIREFSLTTVPQQDDYSAVIQLDEAALIHALQLLQAGIRDSEAFARIVCVPHEGLLVGAVVAAEETKRERGRSLAAESSTARHVLKHDERHEPSLAY
jgi:hypothetical protein